MDSYGIRGPINNWLNMFLPQRKMKAVVEGEQSEEVVVDSGAVREIMPTVVVVVIFKYPLCSFVDLMVL
jgi:hypothetical protein